MAKSNLKVVSDDKLQQLSLSEMRLFAADLTNDICDDDAAVDKLLLIAVHLMEHCHDWSYLDNLGTALAQSLFGATLDWSNTVRAYAEEVRRKVVSNG